MTNMAEMVVRRVEQSWALAQQQQLQQQRQLMRSRGPRALTAYTTPVMFLDTGVSPWLVKYCNAAAAKLAGAPPSRDV